MTTVSDALHARRIRTKQRDRKAAQAKPSLHQYYIHGISNAKQSTYAQLRMNYADNYVNGEHLRGRDHGLNVRNDKKLLCHILKADEMHP